MKKVAGTLRLDLAQYRELAAFAQFGSDLDKATQTRLTRGERLVELLKQPQYEPMPVEEQVAALYAGTRGYLDDVAVGDVIRFGSELVEFMRNQKSEVLAEIAQTEDLGAETEKKLVAAIQEFKTGFKA
jgi:F-type H+-transporting ATPase subunit alpha